MTHSLVAIVFKSAPAWLASGISPEIFLRLGCETERIQREEPAENLSYTCDTSTGKIWWGLYTIQHLFRCLIVLAVIEDLGSCWNVKALRTWRVWESLNFWANRRIFWGSSVVLNVGVVSLKTFLLTHLEVRLCIADSIDGDRSITSF